MGRPAWDEMKLARDGHLSPTTVDSRDHAWVRPIATPIAVLPNGNVLCQVGDGPDAIEYGPGDTGPVALHLGSRRG